MTNKYNKTKRLHGYFSRLGMNIAVLVWLFMLLPALGVIVFHEYHEYLYMENSWNGLWAVLSTPYLWAGIAAAFVALMVVLSEVVILPLKRFELHIRRLEQGEKPEPFLVNWLNRNDEIGFLAERFNSLYKLRTDEIESKDAQLSTLHDFTEATSGILDIPSLMDSFFSILRSSIDFDTAGYLLNHQEHTEGRIYSTFEGLPDDNAEMLTQRLTALVNEHCPGFPASNIKSLDVSVVDTKGGGPAAFSAGEDAHSMDRRLVCFGEPIGVIALFFRSDDAAASARASRVFDAMVSHAGTIIERLLSHIHYEERRLAQILSSMAEGVYLIDKDGHTTSVNKKGLELITAYCKFGRECSKKGFRAGQDGCDVQPDRPCEFSKMLDRLRLKSPDLNGKPYTEEITNDEGLVLLLSASRLLPGADEGYVVTLKDVTEERLILKRAMLSSKLAALGEMAAGIAHEVNNPLQAMLTNLELLDGGTAEANEKKLNSLKECIQRITNIVRELLIFARDQTTAVEDVEINTVILKSIGLVRRQLTLANIDVETDMDRRALMVRCNKNLFQQVIINLLQNAKDAIEESGKGSRICIRTERLHTGITVIKFSDDGPGMDEEVMEKIFDPFFTTKDIGKGTGLGLSVSRRIVEGAGGTIAVESPPGGGTTFIITLMHNEDSRRKNTTVRAKVEPDYSCLAEKSVLIVDDESVVAKAVMEGLSHRVLEVEYATDGSSALDMIMDDDYDLILLDIRMPGMNGMELYKSIVASKPYLGERIIFLTGDTESEFTRSFLTLSGCRFLAKPFTMNELLSVMCEEELPGGPVMTEAEINVAADRP